MFIFLFEKFFIQINELKTIDNIKFLQDYKEVNNDICPGGGIGRRVGLKIRLDSPPVPVQVWLRAIFLRLSKEGLF